MDKIYCGKIIAESVEDAFHKILDDLKLYGEKSSPRGFEITELENCNVIIKNPRNRIVGCKERRFSAPYAFGELAWYLSGKNALDQICYYAKFQEGCSDDGITLNSAYGARIFGIHNDDGFLEKYYPKIEFDQWEQCVKVLSEDKDSRQAIIHLHTPNDRKTKDEVCTLTLQFLVRNGKLNMITTMRSNDVVLGFTYDAFAFTVMQELMANELGVELGYYCHNVGSMHVYTKEYYGKEFDILETHTRADVTPMQPLNFSVGSSECDFFIDVEKHIRNSALNIRNEKIGVTDGMMADHEITMIDLVSVVNDEFTAMAICAFLVKMYGFIHEYEMQLYSAQRLRDCGFEFAADICMLYIKNDHNGSKTVIEGPDGVGKSALADSMHRRCLQCGEKRDIIHYVAPSNIFDYDNNYSFHMVNGRDEIFDRFVFSERIYSKVYGRGSGISEEKYSQIIDMMKGCNARIMVCIAIGEDQEKELVSRRIQEEDEVKLLEINEEYKRLIPELVSAGLKVSVVDVFGNEVNGGYLKW